MINEYITLKCGECNKVITLRATKENKKKKFCCEICAKTNNGKSNKGKTHENRRSPLVSIECKQCHTIFNVKYKHRDRQFCSCGCVSLYFSGENNPSKRPEIRKLISERVSETHWDSSGDKNPKWKGGTSVNHSYYGGRFTDKLKRTIRERDNYICQMCGKENSKQVHHIDYNKANSTPENLITLCTKCHGKCHGRINETQKDIIIKRFKKGDENKIVYV